MGRNYEGKYGTEEPMNAQEDVLETLFAKSNAPDLADVDDALSTPVLVINMEELDEKTQQKAKLICEKLADYFFDQKYIDEHPYIKTKIAQEVDNIRRLLKMLAVNEKAQDTLIMSITTNSGKGTLYGSLTSLQNSMLSMQQQLNSLTQNLEEIFREMQENCEETFEEKDKEVSDDGSYTVRGSKDFIKQVEKLMLSNDSDDKTNIEEQA